jgi:hypothetical protein
MTLDSKSIENAIRELDAYKAWVLEKSALLCERLAQIGAAEADSRYAGAPYDGERDAIVSAEHVGGRRWRITARGMTVAFLEWGAGVYYNTPQAPRPPGVAHIGAYGYGLGKLSSWRFTSSSGETIKTHGTPASLGMHFAGEELRRSLDAAAREVFGS